MGQRETVAEHQQVRDLYINGEYLRKNPGWHTEAAPWKARAILQMLRRNRLDVRSVGDIGCGSGEILRLLQRSLSPECTFHGYEISPQAYELAKERENERLHFHLADFRYEQDASFDLLLLIDVIQHIEDCYGYLRDIQPRSTYTLFQFPIDITAQSVIRNQLITFHRNYGHIHFFDKSLALKFVRDCGYEILDVRYTLPPLMTRRFPRNPLQWPRYTAQFLWRALRRLPGWLLYQFNPDLAVRLLSGWRLMVLAHRP
ncbi:methyltransferase family protein [Thermosporothrix hazakensis]|jgi:SAM-dependent methyltransferase|uniref:Methyltransferase family protein n=2 Tax=Thermosporothrix TaxID=768650 RepID=A0A326U9H0_THEHA|nr:class I SAM-dependent methyltransferase [Thermosporothrix hazakensis]PZW23569.1 methyltransferase family protein [Thermosporothrix hazakensis]BBH86760.1 hypothetical protein KTC_15110 [Thermosporothrix sp. COM3]GCE51063.1 hypothetical protein KTH_59320 [Thermosporothrix hazakensis]